MDGVPLHIAGTGAIADPSGALYVPQARALLVADLHLEKASAFAAAGAMLPPYDSRQTLQTLERVVRRYAPAAVYCLGDSFHDDGGAARLGRSDAARLRRLIADRDWVWIAGNHDAGTAPPWGRQVGDEVRLGELVLRHRADSDGGLPSGEISGHYHPKATVTVRGRRLTGRCFVSDGRRLLLPALGALTGGLDVGDPAIASLFGPRVRLLVLVRGRLLAVTSGALDQAPSRPRRGA